MDELSQHAWGKKNWLWFISHSIQSFVLTNFNFPVFMLHLLFQVKGFNASTQAIPFINNHLHMVLSDFGCNLKICLLSWNWTSRRYKIIALLFFIKCTSYKQLTSKNLLSTKLINDYKLQAHPTMARIPSWEMTV